MLWLRRGPRYTFLLRLTSCWPVPLSTVFPPSLFFPQTLEDDKKSDPLGHHRSDTRDDGRDEKDGDSKTEEEDSVDK